MSVATLYDVHGNLPALEAVLAEAREVGADRVVIGGDVVPGPMPRETLALLRGVDLPVDCIRGNGENAVLALRRGEPISAVPAAHHEVVRWCADQLDDAAVAWLEAWPATLRMSIGGLGDVLFCHATPRSDTEIFTRLTPEDRLRPLFEGIDAALVVCGHTHMPFDRTIGATRVVNAGSVGMPFGEPGAYWLLLGPGVHPRHTAYDRGAAATCIRATRYPQAEAFATGNVLNPPAEAAMLEAFAGAELK